MLITLHEGADAGAVKEALVERGLWVERLDSEGRVHFLVAAHSAVAEPAALLGIRGVSSVASAESAHPRVDAQGGTVRIGTLAIGLGEAPVLMAGPCSVESEAGIHAAAERVAAAGGTFLRGGAFKPRSSPYAFQGHGAIALEWLRRAADEHGLRVVTEAMGEGEAPRVAAVADLVQIGSRNMQNFALLKRVSRCGKPVLLKRGLAATVEEWLLAGEYCLVHGAPAVVFCERGVRGFDGQTRNLLDLGAVALLAHALRLPVLADPSHAAGRRDLVAPLARAALAAGAAGLMIETHPAPGRALSDGPQALSPIELAALTAELFAPPARRALGGAHGGA